VNGQRPDHHCRGRWVATLDLGWSGGKRQRKVLYAKTRKEAQAKLQKALRDKERGAVVIAAPTVESWLTYWLDVICVERGLKVNTMKSHRQKVNHYLIPHLGRHRLDKLTPEHLRGMYRQLRDQGLSEATLRQTHAILHRALKVAEREGKVARNVAGLIDPPATTRNKREGLTLEQARKVLATNDLRAWVALYLGVRQGEALGLMWSDVDLDRGWLHVQRALVRDPERGLVFDTPKSRAGFRDIPLPPKALAQFKLAAAIRKTEDNIHQTEGSAGSGTAGFPELVFHHDGKPIDHRDDWQHWTDLLARVGVPHVALHAARNTTASLLEAAGVPDRVVAQILGQSTVEVTHGYQHAEPAVIERAMLALENVIDGD
jgi:integrase